MNRCQRAILAPLLAVLVLLLGLAGAASAAFNHAATEPHYGNFLLQESEASADWQLEIADPTRKNGEWIYDSASGVPAYVRQNPWTYYDPHGLFLLELIDQGMREVEQWVDNVTDGAGTKTVNSIGSFFVPDPEVIAEDVKSFKDADGKGKLLAAAPLLMESNGATRKLKKYLPKSLRNKVDKVTPKKNSDNSVNPTKSQKETNLAAELEAAKQAEAAKTGGRKGSASTRAQNQELADRAEAAREGTHTAGASLPEQYYPNPSGGRKGGRYSDVEITRQDKTKRVINTVDSGRDGLPTDREIENGLDIYERLDEGDTLELIPK